MEYYDFSRKQIHLNRINYCCWSLWRREGDLTPQPTLGSSETTELTHGKIFLDTVYKFQNEEGKRQDLRYSEPCVPRTGEDTHIKGVGDKVLFSMLSLSCISSPQFMDLPGMGPLWHPKWQPSLARLSPEVPHKGFRAQLGLLPAGYAKRTGRLLWSLFLT